MAAIVNVKPKKKRAPAALIINCDVCDAPAPDHLHFGGRGRVLVRHGLARSLILGHCCYSCRAFFRRTIERLSKMEVVCRTGEDNCRIDVSTKSCSACRYQKCLDIGMTSSLLQVK